LLREDEEVKRALVQRLGHGIVAPDGSIDREAVAHVVFRDCELLAWLEALLHPRVSAEYLRWREDLGRLADPLRVCVTEVPLLYEAASESRFDKVVVITAPRKLREARTQKVLGADREQRLIPDAEKAKRADFVYVNTGTLEELDAFVAGVMEELVSAA
jgi:dephospho-CoA kinase